MMYVTCALVALLMGSVCGWFTFMASAGPQKERKALGWIWGIGFAIILFLAMIGG